MIKQYMIIWQGVQGGLSGEGNLYGDPPERWGTPSQTGGPSEYRYNAVLIKLRLSFVPKDEQCNSSGKH